MRRSKVKDEEAETKKVGATGSGLIETERRSATFWKWRISPK
ncbi:hypothetical protein [Paenibacillus plantarum]|nr:hypothetical protein [Paenibacillus plantarum]